MFQSAAFSWLKAWVVSGKKSLDISTGSLAEVGATEPVSSLQRVILLVCFPVSCHVSYLSLLQRRRREGRWAAYIGISTACRSDRGIRGRSGGTAGGSRRQQEGAGGNRRHQASSNACGVDVVPAGFMLCEELRSLHMQGSRVVQTTYTAASWSSGDAEASRGPELAMGDIE